MTKGKLFFLTGIFLIICAAGLAIFFRPKIIFPGKQDTAQPPEVQSKQEVLGRSDRSPQIIISGPNYQGGGLIALASTDEPAVLISSFDISGLAEVTVYEANKEAVLSYLIHDKDGKQTSGNPDVSQLRQITTFNQQITSGYGKESKLLLPLGESGIWFLHLKLGSVSVNAFIIRSNIGAIVKEGDNEYIFWGQNFKTRRSISEGSLRILNLLNGYREIASASFNSEGIVQLPLSVEADIALVEQGEDKAIVPINLRYLNVGYSYQPFRPKTRQTRYFLFTDRPLYRPGDTLYFKAVIRDDDDARYTIPTGQALVRTFREWDEKNVIFEKNYEISKEGTIDGEFKLPTGIATGYFQLEINVAPTTPKQYGSYDIISFQVEHFRKPEYSIDITTPKTELIAGDKSSFKISGHYFFGQPVSGQKIKYTIYSADFYEYEYLMDTPNIFSDEYRYGFWGGGKIREGEAVFNTKGEAAIEFEAKLPPGRNKSQVFSIEASFDDGTGNPAFARKNVLVYSGEYALYRQESNYSGKVGTQLALPVILKPRNETDISGVSLVSKIHRETWIPYQEPDKKYPSYKKEEEDLPEIKTKTDVQGKATFTFTPNKVGSYKFTVEGKDNRGNIVSKDFYFWVTKEGQPLYTGEKENELAIRTDKAKYLPSESVQLTIASDTPDRDVFLSLERGRVNRFQIVHLMGQNTTVEIPLAETDIPNIWAKASSFSQYTLDTGQANIVVSAETKKLVVNLTLDQRKFGPSETVTANLQTTDFEGRPVSGEVAIWAVDKALFELVDERPEKIFETFWRERYNDTQEAHSLEGIFAYGGGGGGCFASDTPILMADGKTKKIEEVKIGDTILTRQGPTNPKLVEGKVVRVHSSDVAGYLIINGEIKVTANHRLWVNDGWKEAGRIQSGDVLKDLHDQPVVVSSLEWQKGKFTVYNLEVKNYQTYFAAGVWAHNQKGGGVREIFKDTAYWNPAVHTDSSGKAQVSFVLPDNLTTWVITAVGSTVDTKVGQTASEILVTKGLLIRPILPNILRQDDEIILSALVQNFTDQDQTVDVDLKSDSGKIENPTHSGLSISAGDLKQVYWQVHPTKEKEKAKFTFSVRSKKDPKLADIIVQELPLRPFGFWEKRVETGDGPKNFQVQLTPNVSKEKTTLTLSLSPTLLGTLPTAMKYLIGYPYGCTEQTTSRFVPALIAKLNPDIFSSAIADKDIEEIIQKSISKLTSLQHADGGWSWWSSGNSDPFVTAYVVEYLVYAQNAGIKIDNAILSGAQRFLEEETIYDPKINNRRNYTQEELVVRTYGLSLLGSEKGKIIIRNFDLVSSDILAFAVMSNTRNGEKNPEANGLSRLISLAQAQGDGLFWMAGRKEYFGSVDASTALAIRAIIAAGGDKELVVRAARFLARNRQSDYWSNTFATAQVIQVLVDFARQGEELTPNYTYTVSLDEKEIARGTVTNAQEKIKEITIPAARIKSAGSVIALTKSGEGQLYSTLITNEFHTNKKTLGVNHGLDVKREYLSEKGDGSLSVGDTVIVKITVSGLNTEERYAVIADELPSGFIPINPAFKSEQYSQDRGQDYYSSYDVTDREVTENGMVLSLYKIAAGTRTYSYKARAVSEGVFAVPPVKTSLMYAPEVWGRSEAQTVKIGKVLPPKLTDKLPKQLLAAYQRFIPLTIAAIVIISVGILLTVFLLKRRRGPSSLDN